jgi:hypothetical protein
MPPCYGDLAFKHNSLKLNTVIPISSHKYPADSSHEDPV